MASCCLPGSFELVFDEAVHTMLQLYHRVELLVVFVVPHKLLVRVTLDMLQMHT